MTIENSREIEKIFYQDSFSKKRIGSNVHRRTGKGGDKAGVAGGVRFAKNNFKPYEKNSKVKSGNVFEEILSFDKFNTYAVDMQKEMLSEWVILFSKEKIRREMCIGEKRLNNLIEQFNIEVERKRMRATAKEMMEFKDNSISISRFKMLPDDQKYEIVDCWQNEKGMLNKFIAKKLGYATNTFNSKKSMWKKEYKNRNESDENMSKYKDDFLLEGLGKSASIEDKPEEKEIKARKVVLDNPIVDKEKASTIYDETSHRFNINFSGVYTIDNLVEKQEALLMLMDHNKKYKVTVTIEEHEE